MNPLPKRETIACLRERFPKGTRVELVSIDDPYSKLKPGDLGTVEFVDDIGTIHTSWDCGSGLGIVYGEDRIRIISQ